MREIKFRQFINGKFHYWGNKNQDCFIGPVTPVIESQQFTGLHDKHGKEIYEGDIIQYDYDIHLKYPKEVKYQDGMFRKVSQRQQWNALYIDIDRYEVIGNVWENPELVK